MSQRPLLPPLASDPDARLVRWGWIAWLAFAIYLVFRWLGVANTSADDAWGWLGVAPAVAIWLLWPIARGGLAGWRWMRSAPLQAWNGRYFEFDGRQMRVLLDENDIHVVADDVFAALDLRGGARAADRVRLAAGRDGLRSLPPLRELVFTERGLTAWLERRTDEKAVRFGRWFEREVVVPHRRRRDR